MNKKTVLQSMDEITEKLIQTFLLSFLTYFSLLGAYFFSFAVLKLDFWLSAYLSSAACLLVAISMLGFFKKRTEE